MIDVRRFVCNMLEENCYVVSDDSGEAVIIDCGAYYEEERKAVVDYIRQQGFTPVHLLCTHGHFDHVFGYDTIFSEFGLRPEVSAEDDWLMDDVADQVRSMTGASYDRPTPPVGAWLTAGQPVTFGHHHLQVLPTPGHTPGSVLFYCKEEKTVFTGDTLFRLSIGRTDFLHGSFDDMMQSLRNVVAKLPADTHAYCGHGPDTTIGNELRRNPYLDF